jgi:signal transduction histidine kinase/ActR/RegA family two-component response regulator
MKFSILRFLRRIFLENTLSARIFLVLMAFFLMILSSAVIMSNALNRNLQKHADEIIDKTAYIISDALNDPKISLSFIATTVEKMLADGEPYENIKDYIRKTSTDEFKDVTNSDYYSVYIYLDQIGELFAGSGWQATDDFDVKTRPWYTIAMAQEKTEIGITTPFVCVAIEELVVGYARQLYDSDGNHVGVIFLDLPVRVLDEIVTKERITKNAYGLLVDEELNIILHPNNSLIGLRTIEVQNDFARFSDSIERGEAISLEKMLNYRGDKAVLFGHEIENSWYLCIIIPEHEYYRDLHDLVITVSVISIISVTMIILILVQLEKRKKLAEMYSQLMLDSSPICCQIWNRQLHTMDCNEAAVKLYGFANKREYISRFIVECSPEYQPDGVRSDEKAIRLVNKVFEEGYWQGEWLHQHPHDKSPIPAEVTLVRVPHKNDYVVAGYTRDLREHFKMMEEIRETGAELERAFARANAANIAKRDFLATMSHEMRTPLSAIIGMTSVGIKSLTVEKKDHALKRIDEASSHLLSIINNVLDMAKIEANKLELVPVEFDFKKMLKHTVSIINFQLSEKKQILSINVDSNIPPIIMGDDQRLSQVILNLLANAVKFTPEGGEIDISVSLVSQTDAPAFDGTICHLLFEISDTGIGVSAEQQETLFNAFTQAESGTSRKYGGTGLGLTISKRIVELMGGEIWVKSDLSTGTKFGFNIKVSSSAKSSKKLNETSGIDNELDILSKSADEFTGKRMLLAEDVEINREILMSLLEHTGLIIESAENGQQALDMVTKDPERFDIIFMDVQMPKMDGLEATRLIRRFLGTQNSVHCKELPIVALSANVFKDDIQACLNAGMNAHLGKPLDIEKILTTLRKYLT